MTRGLSMETPGTVAGREPVAMTACSNASVDVVPSALVMSSDFASRNAAMPWM